MGVIPRKLRGHSLTTSRDRRGSLLRTCWSHALARKKRGFPLSQIFNFLNWIPFLNSKPTVVFLHTCNCQIISKIVSQQKETRELSSLWFSDVSHIKRKSPAYKCYMRKRVNNVLHLWKSAGILCLFHLCPLTGYTVIIGITPTSPPCAQALSYSVGSTESGCM